MFINLSNTYSIPSVLGIVLGAETMINKLVCLQGNDSLVGMTKGYFQHYDSKNITFFLENDFFKVIKISGQSLVTENKTLQLFKT